MCPKFLKYLKSLKMFANIQILIHLKLNVLFISGYHLNSLHCCHVECTLTLCVSKLLNKINFQRCGRIISILDIIKVVTALITILHYCLTQLLLETHMLDLNTFIKATLNNVKY